MATPYTTVEKVKSLFRDIAIEDATGNPENDTVVTTEEVNDLIAEASSEIEAKLCRYYVVPITGSESLVIVGNIARLKVAHVIKTILESTSENSDKNQEVQTNLEKKAEKLLQELLPQFNKTLKAMQEPTMKLPDSPLSSSVAPPLGGSIFNSNKPANLDNLKRVMIKGGSDGLGGNNW